jgi:hypothetical protein
MREVARVQPRTEVSWVSGEHDRLLHVGNRGMESLTPQPNRGRAGRGGASGVGTTALEQPQSELNVIWPNGAGVQALRMYNPELLLNCQI